MFVHRHWWHCITTWSPISSSSSYKAVFHYTLSHYCHRYCSAQPSESERIWKQLLSMWNAQPCYLVSWCNSQRVKELPLEIQISHINFLINKYNSAFVLSMVSQWMTDMGLEGKDSVVFLGCRCISALHGCMGWNWQAWNIQRQPASEGLSKPISRAMDLSRC